MRTADFDYELPPAQIAQVPLADRAAARLLVLRRGDGALLDRTVRDLPDLLAPGDILVINDTRVLPARLHARRPSGGRVELLLLHPAAPGGAPSGAWVALARPARRLRPGEHLIPFRPGEASGAEGADEPIAVRELLGEGRVAVELPASGATVAAFLRRWGEVPLPPYIHEVLPDPERYQTVYARTEGSAAAPTAGLHFTPELLRTLAERGVGHAAITLHVGLHTFRPVTAEDPRAHAMHAEWYEVAPETAEAVRSARARGGRVVAIGTTAVRTLETAAGPEGLRAGSGWTELYILPGMRFHAVDALLTNFHLPRSTLLMLVSAFAGREAVLAAYRHAVAAGYRFFSFGDAMLIL